MDAGLIGEPPGLPGRDVGRRPASARVPGFGEDRPRCPFVVVCGCTGSGGGKPRRLLWMGWSFPRPHGPKCMAQSFLAALTIVAWG